MLVDLPFMVTLLQVFHMILAPGAGIPAAAPDIALKLIKALIVVFGG